MKRTDLTFSERRTYQSMLDRGYSEGDAYESALDGVQIDTLKQERVRSQMTTINEDALGVSGKDEDSWHRGDFMQLYTGGKFYPMDPKPHEIEIEDIAHALSMICRYGGHARKFYSVAEHCVLMSQVAAPENAIWALLHDGSEAYVGDMVRPLKHQLPEYMAAEDRVIECIIERFGLAPQAPKEVKELDNRILLDERAAVLGERRYSWGDAIENMEPLGVRIRCWSPAGAKFQYLTRFRELTGG